MTLNDAFHGRDSSHLVFEKAGEYPTIDDGGIIESNALLIAIGSNSMLLMEPRNPCCHTCAEGMTVGRTLDGKKSLANLK